MELRDKALVEMGRGNPFKNRIFLIIAALVGLGIVGVLIILLFLFGVLPPGRRSGTASGKATVTQAPIALGTATLVTTAQPTSPSSPVAGGPAPTSTPVIIPTTTPLASAPGATAAPPAGNANSPNPIPGVYVTRLRTDPKPRKAEPINFYLTLVNTTGHAQFHNVCAEIYRVGESKSFGITSCPSQSIPAGTSEVNAGTWTVTGIHACLPLRAHAIARDEGQVRIPLQQPGGGDLWLDLEVCP
jgi:hypothetical protein